MVPTLHLSQKEKLKMRHLLVLMVWIASVMIVAGCGTVGKNFEAPRAGTIANEVTTQADIKKLYGKPFRTGLENGDTIWIYEFSTYRAHRVLGKDTSKDLIIVFDEKGIVKSHQFTSSNSFP